MSESRVYFDVTLAGGNIVKFPSDSGASYSISDAGTLTITTKHYTRHYSPAGWWAIEVRPAVGDPEE